MLWARMTFFLLTCLKAAAGDLVAQEQEGASSIQREGAHLRIDLPDGTSFSGDQLVGLEIDIPGKLESTWSLRFDGVMPDERSNRPGLLLYDVSVRSQDQANWQKFCEADPHGQTTALVVHGHFEAGSEGRFAPGAPGEFTLACTAGARGKCIRYGYPPWETAPGGADLGPYHAACVRMIRADYCGDGHAHTVPGIAIQIIDRVGINRASGVAYGAFEAIWGEAGALCVARPRRPEIQLKQLHQSCPRLTEIAAEDCNLDALKTIEGALLANRSE